MSNKPLEDAGDKIELAIAQSSPKENSTLTSKLDILEEMKLTSVNEHLDGKLSEIKNMMKIILAQSRGKPPVTLYFTRYSSYKGKLCFLHKGSLDIC